MVIFVYLTILTITEYFVAVSFNAASLLSMAVIKAALVMYYYMHIYKLNEESRDGEHSYAYKTGTNWLWVSGFSCFQTVLSLPVCW